MRRGFIFDTALCVNCQACNAACTLENGFQSGTRSIFTWNDHPLPLFRVINLSLACNHCEKPVCAEGCPAKAYTIESSGVVIHHADLCMGCGYCTWLCPYDAPSINQTLGYIEKCHMCSERAAEGVEPACVTACPTGALKITEQESFEPVGVAWFPDTGIRPSLIIKGADAPNTPLVFPADPLWEAEEDEDSFTDTAAKNNVVAAEKGLIAPDKNLIPADSGNIGPDKVITAPDKALKEWSLIAFSLLVISACTMLILYALTGAGRAIRMLPFLFMAAAMTFSIFHLGLPRRGWRAVINVISSPLSREIVAVAMLAILALLHWITPGLIPPVITGIIALLTLVAIDLVYFKADKATILRLHSGQAFFTSLCAVTWFLKPDTAFLIFSMLAAVSVVIRYRTAEKGRADSILYYFRALALPLVFMLIYSGNEVTNTAALVLFMAGLVADRILFYYDFTPVSIKTTIREHFNKEYETHHSDKSR